MVDTPPSDQQLRIIIGICFAVLSKFYTIISKHLSTDKVILTGLQLFLAATKQL